MSATADRSLRPAPTAAAISGWATKDWLVDLVFGDAVSLGGFIPVTVLVLALLGSRAAVRRLLLDPEDPHSA